MATTKLITIEDLADLPDDGHVYEVIDGQLLKRAAAGGTHGAISSRVGRRVGNVVEERALGEVFNSTTIFALRRNPDTGLKPDVSIVRADRLPVGDAFDRPLELVPDLVVEVISPNDRAGEIEDKIAIYLQAGVPLLWVFWPYRRVVTVYVAGRCVRELGAGDELDGGDVLPGFRVAVADLFHVGR
jgi:Uma2 family endonuclease